MTSLHFNNNEMNSMVGSNEVAKTAFGNWIVDSNVSVGSGKIDNNGLVLNSQN
ncbi:MAG: hypothetical protein ABI723_24215 [Bacteroidia bacterium]